MTTYRLLTAGAECPMTNEQVGEGMSHRLHRLLRPVYQYRDRKQNLRESVQSADETKSGETANARE